jgi:hypothetical protein
MQIIVYIANIIVAGWISISALFYPHIALRTVFENSLAYSESIRLVGALWFSIFILSVLGLFFPKQMQLIFLVQLIYKTTWLVVVAAPALYYGRDFPKGMAVFFVIWVILLPLVIDWKYLFS